MDQSKPMVSDMHINACIRGKVSTRSTILITNNLSVYKKVYKNFEVSTSLVINDLSVYINVKGATRLNDRRWAQLKLSDKTIPYCCSKMKNQWGELVSRGTSDTVRMVLS